MPTHDDTDPTPRTSVDAIREEIERYGTGPIRQGDMLDSLTRAVGRSVDHIHAIPPVMQGREAREAANAMRDLAPHMEVLLPRAPEPGSLSLMGAYTGQGRSMFGGVPIRTSPHVPEGSAFLVDRSAMQFRPERMELPSSLDRVGANYGISRLPDEPESTFRDRLRYTLMRPLDGPTIIEEAEARVNPEEQVDSWRGRVNRWVRGRVTEPTLEPERIEFEALDHYDCYLCGTRGTRDELGLSNPEVRASGQCATCHWASHNSSVITDPDGVAAVLDDFLKSVDKPNGPTMQELEATYRV